MFESGFLSANSQLVQGKTLDILEQAKKQLRGRSKLLPIEEGIILKLSHHFNQIWSSKMEESGKKQEQITPILLSHFDKLLECINPPADTPLNTAQLEACLLSSWIIESFKAVYLADSPHKSKDLIQITAKYQSQFTSAPVAGSEVDWGTALLSPDLNIRPIIEKLRASPASNTRIVMDIIHQLNERMMFVADTVRCQFGVGKAQEEFYKQQDRVHSDLIPRLVEITDPITKQQCNELLELLGGSVDRLWGYAKHNILKLITGYLCYIDPFRNNIEQYRKLEQLMQKHKLEQNFTMLINFLTETTEIEEALKNYKERLPIYVYTSLALYSQMTRKIGTAASLREERVLQSDFEMNLLQNYVDYLHAMDIDFFTGEPFYDRMLWVLTLFRDHAATTNYRQRVEQFVLGVVLSTLSASINQGMKAAFVQALADHAALFWRKFGGATEQQRVLDFVSQSLVQDDSPAVSVTAFFHQLQTRDKLDSDPRSVALLNHIFKDEWIIKLISPQFNPTEKVGDEQLLEEFRGQMAAYTSSPNAFLNHTLSFLQEYLEVRRLCSVLAGEQRTRGHCARSDHLMTSVADHLTNLAQHYGHQTIFFKLIYSVLIGFRQYFLGTLARVDDLISVLHVARRGFQLQNGPDYGQAEEDRALLTNLEKHSLFLLLEMRANCMS